jgi:hypothetical protein
MFYRDLDERLRQKSSGSSHYKPCNSHNLGETTAVSQAGRQVKSWPPILTHGRATSAEAQRVRGLRSRVGANAIDNIGNTTCIERFELRDFRNRHKHLSRTRARDCFDLRMPVAGESKLPIIEGTSDDNARRAVDSAAGR